MTQRVGIYLEWHISRGGIFALLELCSIDSMFTQNSSCSVLNPRSFIALMKQLIVVYYHRIISLYFELCVVPRSMMMQNAQRSDLH